MSDIMKNCGPLVVCVGLQSSERFGFYLKDSAVELVVSDTPGGIYLHMIAHNIELDYFSMHLNLQLLFNAILLSVPWHYAY